MSDETPVTEADLKQVREQLAGIDPKKATKTKDENCGNCRYFIERRCHRFPPRINSSHQGDRWTLTDATDWCGEWKHAKD